MDTASEAKLDLINSQLAAKIRTLAEMMDLARYPIKVVQGLRSWAEQQRLWMTGRDENGHVMDAKALVTWAPPGHSWHEFGMAVDCVPTSLLAKPNWDPGSPAWDIYGAKAESLGLTWGGNWSAGKVDRPHVQMTGKFPVSPTDEVRLVWRHVGMEGVWVEAGLQTERA